MYAHPSFVRDTPETLLQLRKITNGSRKRPTEQVITTTKYSSRTVSPLSHQHVEHTPNSPVITNLPKIIVPKVGQWGTSTAYTSATVSTTSPILGPSIKVAADRGKLDLLAMALEQQAAAH